ncbi:hypothetical protein [Prosthecobacter sp.]|jgi:hypothetical protein|uniref:hypothetical protein n=1 Tax=Prosthecobacter sp. TaxID=1965333 RepID=UPI0025FC91E5|nr:hypothetical protein [Prosthecobacter sp.]
MRFFQLLLYLILAGPLAACLWDRDTIAMEARGRLEVVETMVGWFDRYPSEYYQMRLDRVRRELDTEPARLDLYDDAAVACDRLGKHDEAVTWMEKKAAAMAGLPGQETADHRYRLHANLGVFRTHQWIKSPDRDSNSEKLDLAIREVKSALQINPNAHFGRESAHLGLLEWWKAGLSSRRDRDPKLDSIELAHDGLAGHPAASGASPNQGFVKGMCGLIQMGSAQESVDVHALAACGLIHDRSAPGVPDVHYLLSYLSCLRTAELMAEGKTPVFANGNFRAWLRQETYDEDIKKTRSEQERLVQTAELLTRGLSMWGSRANMSDLTRWFHQARQAAKDRLNAKTTFMRTRLAAGLHPDTHPEFWTGWTEPVMPALPLTKLEERLGVSLAGWLSEGRNIMAAIFALLAASCVVAIYIIGKLKRGGRLPHGRHLDVVTNVSDSPCPIPEDAASRSA